MPVFSGRYVFDCWYRHREELPGTKMRLISYGNTRAEVDRSLERLGDEIDIIAGVFDERFLTRYNCAGVVLERVPIGLSVATGDPLAEQDRIGLAELSGHKIFLLRFGMLEDFDSAQTELLARIPDARFTEFDLLDIDVFNRALTEEGLILNIACWSDVHPLFRLIELDWTVTARFGFMLPKEPSETVRRFVDVVSLLSTRRIDFGRHIRRSAARNAFQDGPKKVLKLPQGSGRCRSLVSRPHQPKSIDTVASITT